MTQRFNFIPSKLAGLYRIERNPITDDRGFFSRFYCAEEFKSIGLNTAIAQINHTCTSTKGAIRGMHFQYPPHSETKIVTCIAGEVFDVAIDIRHNSPTFLQWHSEILTADNRASLFIPDGFAHGFQTLTEDCQMLYLHSAMYQPEAEGALNAMDEKVAIEWPLTLTDISERDQQHPMIDSKFTGVTLR